MYVSWFVRFCVNVWVRVHTSVLCLIHVLLWHCLCRLEVSLLLPKHVSSALPCLVRKLCEPAARKLQLILRPVYWAVNWILWGCPGHKPKQSFCFCQATGLGQTEIGSCPKPFRQNPLERLYLPYSSNFFYSPSAQLCNISHIYIYCCNINDLFGWPFDLNSYYLFSFFPFTNMTPLLNFSTFVYDYISVGIYSEIIWIKVYQVNVEQIPLM